MNDIPLKIYLTDKLNKIDEKLEAILNDKPDSFHARQVKALKRIQTGVEMLKCLQKHTAKGLKPMKINETIDTIIKTLQGI